MTMDRIELWANKVIATLQRTVAANAVNARRPPTIEDWVGEVDDAVDDANCNTFARVSLLVLEIHAHHDVCCVRGIDALVSSITEVPRVHP